MKTSESILKIIPALLKAQKAMGAAAKDSKNPYFKSNYADYGAVLEACKGPLNDNNILVLQPHNNREGKNFVETILVHESGEWVSSETEVVCAKQNDPQALGSAITYARRYGLQSLPAMPTEDDDGEKAMARQPKSTTPIPGVIKAQSTPTATVQSVATTAQTPQLAPVVQGSTVNPNVQAAPETQAQAQAEPVKKPSFKDRVKAKTAPAPITNGGFG